jgi:hypothetical protein
MSVIQPPFINHNFPTFKKERLITQPPTYLFTTPNPACRRSNPQPERDMVVIPPMLVMVMMMIPRRNLDAR